MTGVIEVDPRTRTTQFMLRSLGIENLFFPGAPTSTCHIQCCCGPSELLVFRSWRFIVGTLWPPCTSTTGLADTQDSTELCLIRLKPRCPGYDVDRLKFESKLNMPLIVYSL